MVFKENLNQNISIKEKYFSKADDEGYVFISDFATQELSRQSKNIASLLDGEEGMSPEYNLGGGLRYKGVSGNYTDMKVHIDDLEEFIQRVKAHYQ
jgi:hypothetical protein